jgi:hypothetical protein
MFDVAVLCYGRDTFLYSVYVMQNLKLRGCFISWSRGACTCISHVGTRTVTVLCFGKCQSEKPIVAAVSVKSDIQLCHLFIQYSIVDTLRVVFFPILSQYQVHVYIKVPTTRTIRGCYCTSCIRNKFALHIGLHFKRLHFIFSCRLFSSLYADNTI